MNDYIETTLCSMPTCMCPHCRQTFQYDDYYDLDSGDEIDCPSCEKTIHVLSRDPVMYLTLGVKP